MSESGAVRTGCVLACVGVLEEAASERLPSAAMCGFLLLIHRGKEKIVHPKELPPIVQKHVNRF